MRSYNGVDSGFTDRRSFMNNALPVAKAAAPARPRVWRRPETRIAGIYFVVAVLWIFFSDRALLALFHDPEWVNAFQTYKGMAFVTFTALLLFIVIRRELTQRRQTEEALRASEARFRRIFESDMVGVIFWDRNGDITEANRIFLQMIGYSRADLEAGRVRWKDLTPPEYAHLDEKALEQMARTGACVPFEKEYIRRDGRRIPVLLGASFLEDRRDCGVCFVQEISHRKRAEMLSDGQNRALEMIATGRPLTAVLDSLTAWMEELLPGTLCSILLLDVDGVTMHRGSDGSLPSAYCATIDGEKAAEGAGSCGAAVVRQAPVIVSDITTDPLWVGYRETALRHGLRACWSVPVRSSTGHVLGTFANYYREVRAPDAEDLQLLEAASALAGIAIERAQAEAKIRKFNAELEQRVRQRTAQLEAANTELEAFSYSVSHDLRAPLRHVAGFSSLLLQQKDVGADPGSRRMAENIAGAALKMGRLIDDLLVFSRMGRTELNNEAVHLTRLAGEVVAGLQQELADRVIEWKLQPLPTVRGDLAMLRQVFQNLLANAVKYTRDQARPMIEVFCEQQSEELVLAIRDNGVGFDMQYAGKLFGVFQRLHREEDFEGTGIGLANVRRIISRHGGRTWAESQPNQGATFYFSLPATSLVDLRN